MKIRDWSELASADPTAVAGLLTEIKRDITSTSDPLEKALLLLGEETCHSLLGQIAEARQSVSQARQIAPEDNRFFEMHADFHEARLYSTEDRFDEALDRFDAMLAKYRQDLNEPENRYVYEEIQYRRGIALERTERYREALTLLREAESFELTSEDRSDLYCHIGHCHHRLREDELALPYFLKARDLGLSKNWTPSFHYDLGYVYYRLRNYPEAKQEFTICEDQITSGLPAPPAAQVYQMLAYVAQALGQRPESERYSAMVRPS